MRPYRLIAVDLDGTLLMPDGSVSPRSRRAVQRAVEAGYDVVFATGRNYTESRHILDAVGHRDMGVFVSGAVVMDLRAEQVVYRNFMHSDLARKVSGLIESMGLAALALQAHELADADYLATDGVELDEATRQWMTVTSARISRIGRLSEHPHPHTLRVGLVAHRNDTQRLEQILQRELGAAAIVHCLFVPAYDVEVLEVFDPTVNKWDAVLKIAGRRGISAREIVAVGDDVNDISMLKGAGLGAAMGNAKPAVLAAAGRILPPNTQDGLAELLEELAGAAGAPRLGHDGG